MLLLLLNRYYWLPLVSSDYFSLLLVPHFSNNAYYTIFCAVYSIMCTRMQSLNINVFWSKALFLYSLKPLENLRFSDVFLGVSNWNIGWKWVNLIITCLEKTPSKRFVARVYSVLLFIMYTLTQFMPLVSSILPDKIKKLWIFWCFQGILKETTDVKWFNNFLKQNVAVRNDLSEKRYRDETLRC